MATFNYAGSAATAKRLLTKFGQGMTFSLPDTVEDGPPGSTGTTVPGRSITGVGVLLNYQNNEIDGTVIQSGDAKVILEATSEPPENGMKATLNGKTWRVENWEPLSPAGTAVIYTLQVRRV